jgi:hypothetical protein
MESGEVGRLVFIQIFSKLGLKLADDTFPVRFCFICPTDEIPRGVYSHQLIVNSEIINENIKN